MPNADTEKGKFKCIQLVKSKDDALKKINRIIFFCCFDPVLAVLFAFSQYPAALMNLGAILHLNGKLPEAEANYLRALQLKPDDVITQSNLRKLWNIMERQGLRIKHGLGTHKDNL